MNNYNNYHFIIRDLVKQFKNQITCLGENTEKYMVQKYGSNV